MSVSELGFKVFGRNIAAQDWHLGQPHRLLALHGWLDNSASFNFLAPRLHACRIVAPDLAGHGQSDHRSADAPYTIWEDIAELEEIVDSLGWDHFVLMGHSRGAIIATLYAASFAERITGLVLLDGILPEPVKAEDAPKQLARAIRDKRRYLRKPSKTYKSFEEALQSRLRSPAGLSRPAAEAIASRGIEKMGQVFRWRSDPRLRGASEFKLTPLHIEGFLAALQCPTLLLRAEHSQSLSYENLLVRHANIAVKAIDAGHHLHMEDACPQVADEINQFLQHLP